GGGAWVMCLLAERVCNFDARFPRLLRSRCFCRAHKASVAAHKFARASRAQLTLLQHRHATRAFRLDRAAARKIALALSSVRLLQQFSPQHADIGKIAITFPEVEAVTNHKFVF